MWMMHYLKYMAPYIMRRGESLFLKEQLKVWIGKLIHMIHYLEHMIFSFQKPVLYTFEWK